MKKLLSLICFFAAITLHAQPILNWQGTAGTTGPIRVNATYYDENNNLYIGGHFSGSIDLDFGPGQAILTAGGSYDGFVAKYNALGEFQWARRITGVDGEQVNGLTVSGGILYVTGFFLGTATFNAPNWSPQLTTAGGGDIFLARYAADNGNIFTPYRIGGTGNDDAYGVKADAAGNIYIYGAYASSGVNFSLLSGSSTITSSGSNDGYIAKYDASLNLQWVRSYGGGVGINDAVYEIDIDDNGFVYAVGEFGGSSSNFNNGVLLTTAGGADGFIIKINASGTTLWGRRNGGLASTDRIRNIRTDNKGSLYISGTFTGTTINLNPNGSPIIFSSLGGADIFVAKLDTNLATATWIRHMGDNGNDVVNALSIDTFGNVFTTGYFMGTASFPVGTSASSLTSAGAEDVFVSKLNNAGNFVWSYRAGSTGTDLASTISVSLNGNHLFVGGQTGNQLFVNKLGECHDAGAIIGATQICTTANTTYSIAPVTGATSYVWILPSGWTGSSTTNSITATPTANGGIVTVRPVTSCGLGFPRQLSVIYAFDTIDKNLVRHWMANANDQNRDRIANIQLTFTDVVKDTDRFGTPNAAYRITSKSGVIQTGTGLPTGNTTIAFWYFHEPNGSENTLLGSNQTALPAAHPLLYIRNSDNRMFPFSSSGANIGAGTVVAPNQWHHIALVRNVSTFELYLNGTLVESGTNLATTNFERIGNNRPNFQSQGATGKFDEIRIYNAWLTASQIQNLMNFGQPTQINYYQTTCLGSSVQEGIAFSATGVNYQWFKNTLPVGTNSPTYTNIFNTGDTMIAVRVTNQCSFETYQRKYTVNQPSAATLTETVCGSFQIGNKRYARSGQYVDTLINMFGCDSIVTLNLTVNNSSAQSIQQNLTYHFTMNRSDTLSNSDSIRNVVGAGAIRMIGIKTFVNDRHGNPHSAYSLPSSVFITPQVPAGNTPVTVLMWYRYVHTVSGQPQVLIAGNLGASNNDYLGINGSGRLFSINNSNNTTTGTTVLQQNRWYHIAFSCNSSGQVSVYLDGVLEYTMNNMATAPIASIGGRINSTNISIGEYDDIRIYNTTLTQQQILALMRMPGILQYRQIANHCIGQNLNYQFAVSDTSETVFEVYRNNTLVSTNPTGVFNNLTVADTSITIRVFNNCFVENYHTRLFVYPIYDTIRANVCGSYTFNSRTYTTSGTYYDTIQRNQGCATYYTLYINVNDTNGTRISRQNGLIRYWTANSADFARDLVNGDTLSFAGSGVGYANGRNNNVNGAIAHTGTTSFMRTNIPPMNTGSIAFWYFHVSSTATKTLLGSNTVTLPDGHPIIVITGTNTLNVWSNTGTGIPVGTLSNNTWVHIALVRNGSNYSFYLNGNLVSSGNNLSPANFDRMGNNRPGFETQGIDGGRFDDIFIFNRELTAAEVSVLFNSNSFLSLTRPLASCQGDQAFVSTSFASPAGTRFSLWRGGNKLNDTTFATLSNLTLADTTAIMIRAFRNCGIVDYPIYINMITQPINLNNGLLRYWSMHSEDNRNSLTNGQSPYSVTGTIVSALGRSNLDTNGAASITDKALQWINPDLLTTELANTQPYTVSMWHNPAFVNQGTAGTEVGILISNNDANSVAPIQLANNNAIQLLNASGQVIFTGPVLTHNQWHHIVYTNSGGAQAKLYLNGNLIAHVTGVPTWRPERIGNGRPALTDRGARGRYDEIAIYNRVITDAEAMALYRLPAILETPVKINTCNGNSSRFRWRFHDTTPTNYTFYRNANTAFVDSTSLTFTVATTDSIVGLLLDKSCYRIRFTARINKNVSNLNNGLVRFWTMNAKDNRRNIAASSQSAPETFEFSDPQNITYFDGRDGFSVRNSLRIYNKTTFINPGTTGLTNTTVSFWYRPDNASGTELNRVLLSGTSSPSILTAEISGGEIRLRPIGTNDLFLGTSFYTLTPNVFHHIVFIRNGTNYEIYVNDTLRLSGTGISQNNIGRIGNVHSNITVDRGALGLFDDIAIYSRAITRDEVSALFRLPTITDIPDTSVMCAGSSRNFQFSVAGGSASHRVEKSSPPNFNSITTLNANGTSGTASVNNGDRIALVQQIGCATMQYNFYPNVQGSSSPGPALNYNANTRNISVNTSFNQIRLFRNGSLLFTNNSGNLNYTSPFRCGDYYAEYITTGSNCPQISPTLQVSPIDTFNRTANLCPGRSITFGTLTITSPGVYIQTFNGVVGNCDSTVRLTVNNGAHTSSSITRTGCGSIVLFGKTYTQSGQYLDTIPNAAGCDSVITLNLTITPGAPSINNITASACYSYSLNNKTYTQTGIYRDTLYGASVTGCDSILVINLTIRVSRVTLPPQTACKRYVFNNKIITASGTYRDTLTNIAGCDSIITITVTINNVDKTVSRTGNTLTATGSNITAYQWINCSNNLPISGATSSTYTVTATGNYAVILTGSNGCIDTSSCVSVTITPCNLSVSHSILNPGPTPRCKNVQVLVSNATAPITYNISWPGNPNGNTLTKNDTFHVYNNVCPETYKLVVTDDRGCKDSVSFTINEPSTSLGEQDALGRIVVYPNPANRLVTIQGLPVGAAISIYNSAGKLINELKSTTNSSEIDTHQWDAGIYLIRVQHEQEFKTLRIQIAH